MPVCNCSFSFGGRGIYFGGKDVLLSELSGAFAISAEAGQADKQGVFKSARVTMQFGGAHLASAQRYLHMPQSHGADSPFVKQALQYRKSASLAEATHIPNLATHPMWPKEK